MYSASANPRPYHGGPPAFARASGGTAEDRRRRTEDSRQGSKRPTPNAERRTPNGRTKSKGQGQSGKEQSDESEAEHKITSDWTTRLCRGRAWQAGPRD